MAEVAKANGKAYWSDITTGEAGSWYGRLSNMLNKAIAKEAAANGEIQQSAE